MTPEQVELLRVLLAQIAMEPREYAPITGERAFDDALINEFIFSMLLWEASLSRARTAFEALARGMVDYNELRVSLVEEIVGLIGADYPMAGERALRLRSGLSGIFAREHAVSLASLRDQAKRDARGYLASLSGVPAFVAARVALVGFGTHALPADTRTVAVLASLGILPADLDPERAAGSLEHALRAGEAWSAHIGLELWMDANPSVVAAAQNAVKPRAKSRGGRASGDRSKDRRRSPESGAPSAQSSEEA